MARLALYALLGDSSRFGPQSMLEVVSRVALSGATAGLASGALFATIVMLAERRRDFATLPGRRFALWGLGAGILFIGGANVVYAVAGRWPLDLGTAIWTAFYGVVGAGIGIVTYRLARRHSAGSRVGESRDAALTI
ncbi:MAG TPA: hypothetical protein VGM67_00235 [Gemmatimonadaceae bacterium]